MQNGQQDPLADIVKDEIWPNPLKFFNCEVDDESDGMGEVGLLNVQAVLSYINRGAS